MINHPILALILRVLSAVFSFGFSVMAAHVLGLETFGIFNVLLAFINIGVVFALLGHESMSTRVIGALGSISSGDNQTKMFGYVNSATRSVWLATFGVVLVEYLLLSILPMGSSVFGGMWLLIFLIILIARTRLSQGIIRGAHLASLAIIPDGILRPGIAMLGLAAMMMVEKDTTALLIGIMIGSAAISVAVGKHWESHALKGDYSRREKIRIRHQRFSGSFSHFSGSIYISSILAVFSSQMAIIATGNFADAKQAGLYAAAERFALAAALISQAIYQAIASRFASFYAKGKQKPLRNLVRKVTRRVTIATFVVCSILAFSADPLLQIYGSGFESARSVFTVLLITVLINASAGPAGILLLMTSNEKKHLIALSVSVITQMILFPVIVPSYGMLGAAWIVLISTVIWNGLMVQFVHRMLTMNRILAWA